LRERAHKQGERQAEGEADSMLSREPNAGLDPRTPGSRPELKAEAHLTEPPRCLSLQILTSRKHVKSTALIELERRKEITRCHVVAHKAY